MKSNQFTSEEILDRIKKWCDLQERSHFDVKQKLASWKIFGHEADEILAILIEGNYLNEERFAKAYVSGKFRIKKWGRNKIIQGLKAKRISQYCIKSGLKEIQEDEYQDTLNHWIERKNEHWSDVEPFERRGKISHFLIRKGFEKELVWDQIMSIIK